VRSGRHQVDEFTTATQKRWWHVNVAFAARFFWRCTDTDIGHRTRHQSIVNIRSTICGLFASFAPERGWGLSLWLYSVETVSISIRVSSLSLHGIYSRKKKKTHRNFCEGNWKWWIVVTLPVSQVSDTNININNNSVHAFVFSHLGRQVALG